MQMNILASAGISALCPTGNSIETGTAARHTFTWTDPSGRVDGPSSTPFGKPNQNPRTEFIICIQSTITLFWLSA